MQSRTHSVKTTFVTFCYNFCNACIWLCRPFGILQTSIVFPVGSFFAGWRILVSSAAIILKLFHGLIDPSQLSLNPLYFWRKVKALQGGKWNGKPHKTFPTTTTAPRSHAKSHWILSRDPLPADTVLLGTRRVSTVTASLWYWVSFCWAQEQLTWQRQEEDDKRSLSYTGCQVRSTARALAGGATDAESWNSKDL